MTFAGRAAFAALAVTFAAGPALATTAKKTATHKVSHTAHKAVRKVKAAAPAAPAKSAPPASK